MVLTHWARDKMVIFPTAFSNAFSWNVWIPTKSSFKFVPNGPVNKVPALVQIMAWHWPGDRPLSEPMIVTLAMHLCLTRPQWVKIPFLIICVCDIFDPVKIPVFNHHIGIRIWHMSPELKCAIPVQYKCDIQQLVSVLLSLKAENNRTEEIDSIHPPPPPRCSVLQPFHWWVAVPVSMTSPLST